MRDKRRVLKLCIVAVVVLTFSQLLSVVVMMTGQSTTYGEREWLVARTESNVALIRSNPVPGLGMWRVPHVGYVLQIGFLKLVLANDQFYRALVDVRASRLSGGGIIVPHWNPSATEDTSPGQCRIPEATSAAGASGMTDSAGSPAVLDATIGVAPSADQSAAVR